MNYKGGTSKGERAALRDIAQYHQETIKDKNKKHLLFMIVTSTYLYKNGKIIRKQNDKLYKTFG